MALAFFILSVRIMSGNGVLPGNDPGVHFGHIYEIIETGRISLEEFSLISLFHVLVATLLTLAGDIDVLQAAFFLKILISFISALDALAVYLFCREPFGKLPALLSSIFLVLSVPLMEITSWGGYTNMAALLYITFLFYLLTNRHFKIAVKFLLIGIMALTLFLLHYLSAFVFALIFVPIFLIEFLRSLKEGKSVLIPFAILLSLFIAAGVWYLSIYLPYLSIAVYHLFFEMKTYTYAVDFVNFDYFLRSFGVTLFLTMIGIPMAFLLMRRSKKLEVFGLLLIWVMVPVLLSQSYLFGVYLPYPRFLYYLTVPIAILSGVAVYGMSRIPVLIAQRLSSFKIERSIGTRKLLSVCAIIIIIIPLTFQFVRAYPEIGGMPSYYSVCPFSGYDAGMWLKMYSSPDAVIVAPAIPGSWVKITAQREAMEEVSPIFGRSEVADTVLSLCYEMENYHTLIRRQTPSGYVPSVDVYVSAQDLWQRVLRIPDDGIHVSYEDETGGKISVVMSNCVKKRVYWANKSPSETLLVLENSFESFTLQRIIAMRKVGLPVEVTWRLIAHKKLRGVELRVDSSTNPSFNFDKVMVLGVLEWGNPWDKPSSFDENGGWAVVECPPNKLTDDHVALLDSVDGLLVVLKFDTIPDWLNVGALGNRLIDAVRVNYRLGSIEAEENRTIYSSILTQALDSKPYELSDASIKQLLESKVNWGINARDYLTYIRDYNIKFIVGDPRFISPDFSTSPLFNKVFDNGRFVIYSVKDGSEPS